MYYNKNFFKYWSENFILAVCCPLIWNFMTVGKYVFLSLLSLNFEPRTFEPIINICLQICNLFMNRKAYTWIKLYQSRLFFQNLKINWGGGDFSK